MKGNCYEVAGCYLLDAWTRGEAGNLVLVHGRPTLQVTPFCEYGHAWIEIAQNLERLGAKAELVLCLDTESGVLVPRELFYKVGRIDPASCLRYRIEDLRRWVVETGHWGPWEGPEACGPVGRSKAAKDGARRARRKGR